MDADRVTSELQELLPDYLADARECLERVSGILLALALRAVRRGEHRLHGHLMTSAFTLAGLRLLLHPGSLAQTQLSAWGLTLAAAGTTILLGRKALAWR